MKIRPACLFSLSLLCGINSAHADDAARPNILLAIGDNWGWPHASVLGDPTVRTPAFDRIVREGWLFEQAFCPVPSCSPTRASLLTGRPAHQLEQAASLWSGFPRKLEVFTDLLTAAGYQVGFAGKGWGPGRFREYGWEENPAGTEYRDFDDFLARRDPARPFFFWLGNTDVSLNKWEYGPEHWGGMDPTTVVVPPHLPDTREVRESILAYYGAVQRQDAAFAAAFGRLETIGLLDDTLVICTSDNGWQMPRGLANCHDTGTRIPLAMRWGSRLEKGRRVTDFVSLTDLAPTFLELAGITVPPAMTGRSVAGLLLGKTEAAPDSPRDTVFLERERHANVRRGDLSYPVRGIRTRDWLYLWNLRPDRWPAGDPEAWMAVGDFGDVDGSWAKDFILSRRDDPAIRPFFELSFGKRPAEELYDLRNDPHQLTNLAADPAHSDIRRDLRARVEAWMRDTGDPRIDPAFDGWDHHPYYGGGLRDADGRLKPPRPPRWLPRLETDAR
ncbi:MAG: sulfatase [Verrucomicrobiales bacterium]|nr:sulfatase [Verrucomicrobiales bacterium]